jgi:hypothetical protein
MSLTTNWSTTYDRLILEAISRGAVSGALYGRPTAVIESGLAHVFFYDDTVYKLYKTFDDKDHFIKGVFAPTIHRTAFLKRDFLLNQHFSPAVHQELFSVYYREGKVAVVPFDESSIYTLVKMSRLDFSTNLHEQLLRGEVAAENLFLLGRETARAIASCNIIAPETLNWYEIAIDRIRILKQFIAWLPAEIAMVVRESGVLELCDAHLVRYREEYEAIRGADLTVTIDNHDENVFFKDGTPQCIDVLPPMRSWWFGVPYANLSNLMVNVETLHSEVLAKHIERGYFSYFEITSLPTHRYQFTHAFAHLLSIAHFGSVRGKEEVTQKYLARLPVVKTWLQ